MGSHFTARIRTQSWNYKIKSGCQGMMGHIDLPMHSSLWNPRPFPLQALNPSISATLEQAGEDSLKAQKDPEPEKVSSEQARNSVIVLVWRIYLGFLDVSGMYWIPKPAPFLITSFWTFGKSTSRWHQWKHRRIELSWIESSWSSEFGSGNRRGGNCPWSAGYRENWGTASCESWNVTRLWWFGWSNPHSNFFLTVWATSIMELVMIMYAKDTLLCYSTLAVLKSLSTLSARSYHSCKGCLCHMWPFWSWSFCLSFCSPRGKWKGRLLQLIHLVWYKQFSWINIGPIGLIQDIDLGDLEEKLSMWTYAT